MRSKRLCTLLLCVLVMLLLVSCGGGEASAGSVSASKSEADASVSAGQSEPAISVVVPVDPEPEPEPVLRYTNPLTGEGCETDISKKRPIAVMINNHKNGQPQLGISKADILYEIPAEGGITRMMAVFQDVSGVGNIGTVRSARDYYASLALGMDALYLHAGGSPQAYQFIKNWGMPAFDCVNGPYEGTLYWRDAARKKNKGLEHSVLTSSEKILKLFPTYRYRLEHKEGYFYPMSFAEEATPVNGEPANTITVKFSEYKTGIFRYDGASGLYKVEQFGQTHTDGNTGEQLAVKNVLVLQTDIYRIKGDSAGRLSVRTTGSGKGKFACGGKVENITWSRTKDNKAMTFLNEAGEELQFGIGTTYINIVGGSTTYTFA